MIVNFRKLDGTIIYIEADENDTIKSIKNKIYAKKIDSCIKSNYYPSM